VSCAGADVAAQGARQLPAAAVREQCALPAVSRARDLGAERDGRTDLLSGKMETETTCSVAA
jgi:hypothetical protein